MTKLKKSLLIFSMLALIIGAALATFIVLSLTDSLKDEPIALEFEVDDADKVYDGEPLKASKCRLTSGNLIEGHTPVISYTGEQTDVGTGFSSLDVKILDKKGVDVSKQYDIKVNGGNLYVSACSLRVSLTAYEIKYSGSTIDLGDGYAITNGKLAAGHKVLLKINDAWLESVGKIVAGRTLNRENVTPLIVDANGRNVTSNYDVTLIGKVDIVQRGLTVSAVSAEKTYDGKPLIGSGWKIESGSLASDHRIEVNICDEYGGPAQVRNANEDAPLSIFANVTIYDAEGDDVTENYALKTIMGELKVNKANLTITAMSESWVYDGTEHSVSGNKPASAVGLVYGEVVAVTYSDSIKDVSVKANSITKYSVMDENGIDKTDNYNVTLIDGKIEVTKAPLTVKWSLLEKEYDGEPFTSGTPELYTVSPQTVAVHLQLDEAKFNVLLSDIVIPGNSTYTFSDFKILDSTSSDITEMFNVSVIPGNVKITRKKVSLEGSNSQGGGVLYKTYDGNFTFTEGVTISDLVSGHSLAFVTCVPTSSNEITGMYSQASIKSVSLVDGQGNDVSGYYEITNFNTSWQLIIDKKDLEISTKSYKKIYDGLPLSGGMATHGGLAYGDSLVCTPFEMTDAGEEENIPEIKIFNGNGADVTDMYTLNGDYGSLTISAKPVTVYFPDNLEIEYDDNGIEGIRLIEYIQCNELDASNFRVANTKYYELGLHEVEEFTWWEEEDSVSKNYNIISGNRKFKIVKRTNYLPISTYSNSKTFDNNALTVSDIEAIFNSSKGSLQNDGTLQFISSNLTGKVNAGEYDAQIIYESSYDRYIVTGTYTIESLSVRVNCNNVLVATYNGLPYQPSNNALNVQERASSGLWVGSKFAVKNVNLSGDTVNVGNYTGDRALTFKSVDIIDPSTGETISSSNIKVDLVNSKIEVTINKRNISIYIETITCTEEYISSGAIYRQDITSLVKVSNLAEGDEIVYYDEYGQRVEDINEHFSLTQVGSFLNVTVKIYRNGVDVTSNYFGVPDGAEGITGTVIIT